MPRKTKNERCELRVTTDQLKRWRFTAALDGRSLSDWMREVCNAATKEKR